MGVTLSSSDKDTRTCAKTKCDKNTTAQSSLLHVDDYEMLIAKRMGRRLSNWCRLCVSETCLLDNKQECQNSHQSNIHKSQIKSTEETFRNQLQMVKQKRRLVYTFLDRAQNLCDVSRLATSRLSYLGDQHYGIPLCLMEALGFKSVLVFSLIPLFSNLGNSVKELRKHTEAEISTLCPAMCKEYSQNSQGQRRVALSLSPHQGNSGNGGIWNSATFLITEEILRSADGITSQMANAQGQYRHDFVAEAQDSEQNSSTASSLHKINNSKISEIKASSSKSGIRVGNDSVWKILFECHNASLSENRLGRFLVEGEFPCKSSSPLPFRLIIFPHKDSTLSFSGTFMRRMETAKFSLRWKFHDEILDKFIKLS